VETNERGWPVAVSISRRRLAVREVLERWRIDDEWWRQQPVSRAYFSLHLEDGRTLSVYRDLVRGRWWRQEY
jgi:hypothetical protein